MISLCFNKDEVLRAIERVDGSGYIKTLIYTYYKSYGTEYMFNEFFLQYNESKVTAVILRYNTYIYLICDDNAHREELCSFLKGFNSCVLLCDRSPFEVCDNVKSCYLMSKHVDDVNHDSEVREVSDSPKIISDLVAKDMCSSAKDDFYLNTAHQLRHNTLRAFACFAGANAVSVAGVTQKYKGIVAITFVYTDEYFRGNGYSKKVLNEICSLCGCECQLLCEEHNLKFYQNCGFVQVGNCIEIHL